MKPQDHCERLTKRLRSAGLADSVVRHVPALGYYVAPMKAESAYGAYGAGSDFYAVDMTLAQAEAFVGGMVSGMLACRRAGL